MQCLTDLVIKCPANAHRGCDRISVRRPSCVREQSSSEGSCIIVICAPSRYHAQAGLPLVLTSRVQRGAVFSTARRRQKVALVVALLCLYFAHRLIEGVEPTVFLSDGLGRPVLLIDICAQLR